MLKFYNTLTRKKNLFQPIEKGKIKIYTCGPTVYNYAHIGNLSAYLFADLLKRYLRYLKYDILDVMNLTDVDDKTIKASQERSKSLKEYTSFFADALLEDFEKLNIAKPRILCRATAHIKEMIALIQKLIDKGYAYKTVDGSVYYKISAFKDYGKFARLKKRQLKGGASGRVNSDEYNKEEFGDFALWKSWNEKDGDISWDSPFGNGRPGWHIECSAMSMKYLGETFDIHTGAIDLIFPHHQNEIAQSEAATGKQLARFWLHRGFLKVDGKKMSKSLGNIYTLKDIIKKVGEPLALRYLILTNHYRLGLNFSFHSLNSSLNALNKLRAFVRRVLEIKNKEMDKPQNLKIVTACIKKSKNNFITSLNDDLNAPAAIADLFDFMSKINKLMDRRGIGVRGAKLVLDFLKDIDHVWGFLEPKEAEISEKFKNKIEKLVKKRNEYRLNKEWEKSDKIRKELIKMGIVVRDEKGLTKWEFKE